MDRSQIAHATRHMDHSSTERQADTHIIDCDGWNLLSRATMISGQDANKSTESQNQEPAVQAPKNLAKADLEGANLKGVLTGADVMDIVNLWNADLTDADLTDIDTTYLNFEVPDWLAEDSDDKVEAYLERLSPGADQTGMRDRHKERPLTTRETPGTLGNRSQEHDDRQVVHSSSHTCNPRHPGNLLNLPHSLAHGAVSLPTSTTPHGINTRKLIQGIRTFPTSSSHAVQLAL